MYHNLRPAYGRDYKSKAAIMDALLAGKDFILDKMMETGIVGLDELNSSEELKDWSGLQVRYGKLMKVCVVTPSDLATRKKQMDQDAATEAHTKLVQATRDEKLREEFGLAKMRETNYPTAMAAVAKVAG